MRHLPRLLIGLILLGGICAAGWLLRHRFWETAPPDDPSAAAESLEITRDASQPLPAAPPSSIGEYDWPQWRGRDGANHARGELPPLSWSEEENLLWKTPLPGRGHSSPIVLGDRIFLTTADEAQQRQSALAIERGSGRILWRTLVHEDGFLYANPKNSHASPTPATDGERVFTLFAHQEAIWLSALSLDGELLWRREVGPYVSKEGFGASPLIVGPLVIVAADNLNRSWLAAVHRTTGEVAWRVPRGPGISYATPAIVNDAGEPQVVMAGLGRVEAYRPESGETLWSLPGPNYSASTPAFGEGMLFVTSSVQESGVMGIRLDGDAPETVWTLGIKAEVPSPLYHAGLVYLVQDIGVMACVEAASGEVEWRKRLGSNVSSSPVLVGEHVLVGLEDGRTLVLRHGTKFERVYENVLEGEIFATPTVSRGQIFLRTTNALYCIAADRAPSADEPFP